MIMWQYVCVCMTTWTIMQERYRGTSDTKTYALVRIQGAAPGEKKPAPEKKPKKKLLAKVPNLKFDLALFRDWNMEMFRYMCVLAGCDYTVNTRVKGLGLGSAVKLVHCYRERALDVVVSRFDLPVPPLAYVENVPTPVFRKSYVAMPNFMYEQERKMSS